MEKKEAKERVGEKEWERKMRERKMGERKRGKRGKKKKGKERHLKTFITFFVCADIGHSSVATEMLKEYYIGDLIL